MQTKIVEWPESVQAYLLSQGDTLIAENIKSGPYNAIDSNERS